MRKNSKIYIAGHRGLVGSAILRRLRDAGYENLIFRTRSELDLTSQQAVESFFDREKPEYVFLAAAKVGGILGNSRYPADFIYENIAIQTHVIRSAHRFGVRKLLFLGSSCIYPRLCPQPMQETHLMTGPLDPTNSPYAVAKIAGIEMCWAYNRQHGTRFLPVMPTNLYGPDDNFDLETSHVLPALIRKFHLAKLAASGDWEGLGRDEKRFGPIPNDLKVMLGCPDASDMEGGGGEGNPSVSLWGTGIPRREFLHVDDLADACLHLMTLNQDAVQPPSDRFLVNIGVGNDLSIRELANLVADTVGYRGEVVWDSSKPDGTPRKLLDVSALDTLGWKAKISLEDGIRQVYKWYRGKE